MGPTTSLPFDAKPVDYFLQLFPQSLFEKIKVETERYAHQKGKLSFQTSVEEMRAYLGMLFLMGVVRLPGYRHYWSKNTVLRQAHICNVMTRNRYEVLTQCVCVSSVLTCAYLCHLYFVTFTCAFSVT